MFDNLFFKKEKIFKLYENILFRLPDNEGLKHYLDSNIEYLEDQLLNSEERKNLLKKNNFLLEMPRDLPKSCCVNFWDTDTEETFKNNLKNFKQNWLYFDKKINYNLNSLGYRMKEFDEINWHNYMLVLGCSFTAGTGLCLEDTWSYKISKYLKYDLVNAAIPGGCNETILINLVNLLTKKVPPKFIVINWTSITRKCYWYKGSVLLYGSIIQKNDKWKNSYENYINNKDQWHFEFLFLKKQVDLICNLIKIPVWHITNFNDYNFVDDVFKIIPNYCDNNIKNINSKIARDYDIKTNGGHPGIELQEQIFNVWYKLKGNF